MKKTTIYLSGASGNVSETERWGWRDYCYDELNDTEFFEVIHPHHHFTYEKDSELPMRIIMDYYFKISIEQSDVVLVNLSECNRSIGTALEIGYALAKNKLIIGIRGDNCYPYVQECCSYVCDSVEDAIDFIRGHF